MKKILLFLTIIGGSFFMNSLSVQAAPAKFYEAEYIPDIYVVRQQGSVKHYQQGRVFRSVETNEVAYCLQPFALFDQEATYEGQDKLASLDEETTKKIKDVVSFAYPIGDNSLVYYMATQLRIWQIVEPDCEFYFTKGLNGPKTTDYNFWFNVIDDNIRVYKELPPYANQTFTTTIHGDVSISIPFSTTYQSIVESPLPYKKDGQTIIFSDLKEGTYSIKVRREYNHQASQPILFYYHNKSQQLVNRGFTEDMIYPFQIRVVDTSIHLKKVDKDTQSKIPSGSAKLEGAIFGLYQNEKKIATITLDENLEATISVGNKTVDYLPFGTYTLKEEKAGKGYLLEKKEFKITLDEQHPHIEFVVENQVIKNKVVLKKLFGETQLFKGEANVEFEIYTQDGTLLKTVKTGQDGKVTFELPYGIYRIHQKTSKEGYEKVEDFEIVVEEDGIEHHYTLYDHKTPEIEIEVPDTKTNAFPFFPFLLILLGAFYEKKKMGI